MIYSNSSLDRADELRKNEQALKRIRQDTASLLVPVWKGKSLIGRSEQDNGLRALTVQSVLLPDHETVFLGRLSGQHLFAVDVSEFSESDAHSLCREAVTQDGQTMSGEFQDLRSTGALLAAEEGSLLAYARGLVYWNANTRFCSRCGTSLSHHYHGHARICSESDCGHTEFPRVDPAVIMLVLLKSADPTKERCLLGRAPAWPENVFSTLAGFVEPGESLEMAVQREVLEEASIHTTDVRYIASQPWPFPRSIMLGFQAEATSSDIRCDPDELDDAQWFTRAQVREFGQWGDDSSGYKLPRKDSIARFLIERWLKN